MLKKHKLEVKMVKDGESNELGMESIPSRPNHIYELGMLIDFNFPKIVKGVLIYKTLTTVLRAAEHVVVTKVK